MFDLSHVYRKQDSVVSRKVAGESLLIPIRGRLADLGELFSLSHVAEFVWDRIDGTTPLGGIRDDVVRDFDVDAATAESDLLQLTHDLAEAGLIESVPAPVVP